MTPAVHRAPIAALLLLLSAASCEAKEAPASSAPVRDRERALRSRPAVHAGSWYPESADELRRALAPALAARAAGGPPVLGLIAPHAGLRYSGLVAAKGYAELRAQKVQRVFLLGPSHSLRFTGVALTAPGIDAYDTPFGPLAIDAAAVQALRAAPGFAGPTAAHDREHSVEMQAVLLAAVHPEARIVPLVVGELSEAVLDQVVAAIRPLLGPGDVVVASSDFTHFGESYGYVPFRDRVPEQLHELLQGALRPLLAANRSGFEEHLAETGDTICGHSPIRLLVSLLPKGVSGTEVSTDTSGATTGDYESSVTYAAVAYRGSGWTQAVPAAAAGPVQVLDSAEQQLALRMARMTLESYLADGRVLSPAELFVPAKGRFQEQLAVFVTLTKNGELRGCIGHIEAVQELWRDIRDNAIAAAVEDPRFPKVQRAELAGLHIEVSVLTKPRPIEGPEAFAVGRHGIILQVAGRRALFLPQVAPEQGWDRDQTLDHLAQKAGLPRNAWRSSDARFEVFEAQVFGERFYSRGDRPAP